MATKIYVTIDPDGDMFIEEKLTTPKGVIAYPIAEHVFRGLLKKGLIKLAHESEFAGFHTSTYEYR